MGRPRKTVSQHKQNGTYRKDRHARTAPEVDGVPFKPDDLEGHASALWDAVEDHLIAIGCGEVDSISVGDACRWYSAFRIALEAGDSSEAARCWRPFNSIAARYGLTIGDRQKLELPAGENLDDLEAKHFGVVS